MPLIQVQALDYSGYYNYAPPQVVATINTDDIQSVKPTEARGIGPFVSLRFRNGEQMTCVGTPEDILNASNKPTRKPMEPYLKNRANGIDGVYCIARDDPSGYTQFWNNDTGEWVSAGTCFDLR